jgi:type I restriction-modification system DNA methylase subunit
MGSQINMPQETRSAATKKSNGSSNGDGHVRQFGSFSEASNFLWPIADLLRGVYKQYDYGKEVLLSSVRKHIDLLHEYRQALITAAVTGQIDIPAEAA